MTMWNRRHALAGLSGAAAAALWLPPSADALGLAGDKIKRIRYYTHVVSVDYFLSKVGAAVPAIDPVAEALRTVVPEWWRVPVNLGDNMHVVARRAG